MANRRGRRTEDQDDAAARQSLALTVRRMRAEFETMQAWRKREIVAYVTRLLDEEHRDIERQRRRVPSPLACIAGPVYGIEVTWLPAQYQVIAPEIEPEIEVES
jgi:hypothetical protein